MTANQQKVTAYITRVVNEDVQLLTMTSNDTTWAGVEVPGGTVDAGENLETALFREVKEEADLTDVEIISYLGDNEYISRTTGERIIRHNYHLCFNGQSRDSFQVIVESNDKDNGWLYDYEWVSLSQDEELQLADKLQPGLIQLRKRILH